MSSRIAVLLLLVLPCSSALSQHRPDAIIFEAGGQGLYYSLSYERQKENGLLARIGTAWYPGQILLPLSIGKVFGSDPHHFEAGFGVTPRYFKRRPGTVGLDYDTRIDLFLTGFLGYRYQAEGKRLLFRAGVIPVWHFYSSRDEDYGFVPWPGISVGYRL